MVLAITHIATGAIVILKPFFLDPLLFINGKMFPTQNAESSIVAFVVTVLCAETVTLIVV